MQARMTHPAFVVPGAMQALQALGAAVTAAGLPAETHALVQLRSSQINGCSFCVEMHAKELQKLGVTDERIFAVGAWRESPRFSDGERAALALSEAMTRISDRADAVPDDVWEEAADNYSESELAALVLAIANINLWNRLNAATRQIAGPIPG